MKRILFAAPNLITAGSGLVILELLRNLDRSVFEPILCLERRGGLDVAIDALGVSVIEHSFLVSMHPWHSFPYRLLQASKPFQSLGVDIWHSWNYTSDFSEALVAKLAGVRHWIYTKKNLSWGGLSWRIRSLLAHRIVTINPKMINSFFSSLLFRHKVRYIPLGVNSELFQRHLGDGNRLRAVLGIGSKDFLVGNVGILAPNKNQIILLRAAALAHSKPHVLLIGRGDDKYEAQLNSLADELGIRERLHFYGAVDNNSLPVLLNELDVFALTSQNEGLSVALLEAMACERACVSTRCGGPETIISDRVNGLLVECDDPNALATSLDGLASDLFLRESLGRDARHTILDHFTLEQQTQGYNQLYRELCGLPFIK
jgi:glycosyltransferase involved in cell wall biosynthesis